LNETFGRPVPNRFLQVDISRTLRRCSLRVLPAHCAGREGQDVNPPARRLCPSWTLPSSGLCSRRRNTPQLREVPAL